MLETVLKNTNVSAVPNTFDEYEMLLERIRENDSLY